MSDVSQPADLPLPGAFDGATDERENKLHMPPRPFRHLPLPENATTAPELPADFDDNIGAKAAEAVHRWKYGDDGKFPTAADVDIAYVVLTATWAALRAQGAAAERKRLDREVVAARGIGYFLAQQAKSLRAHAEQPYEIRDIAISLERKAAALERQAADLLAGDAP